MDFFSYFVYRPIKPNVYFLFCFYVLLLDFGWKLVTVFGLD